MGNEKAKGKKYKEDLTFLKELQRIYRSIPEFPTTYISTDGKEFTECPGAYNDYMVRAMASDMVHYWVLFKIKAPETSKLLESAMPKMNALHFELLRMMDDLNGDRPVKPWQFKKVEKFMQLLKDASKKAKEEITDEDVLRDFEKRIKAWISRLGYMDTWALYLRESYEMSFTLMEAETKEYDNNGNLINGLSNTDKDTVKIVWEIRKLLFLILLKVPFGTKDYDVLLEKLEILKTLSDKIMETR